MSDHQDTQTQITAVCIRVGDDPNMTTVLGDSGPYGSVFVGGPGNTVQFYGTAAQLLSLAAAIIDGADDIDAQIAERTDADIERERVAHYSALAAEAEALADKAANDLDTDEWASR